MNDSQSATPESHERKEATPKSKQAEKIDVKGTTEVMITQADVAGELADLNLESSESAESGESFKEGEKQGKAKQGSGATDDDEAVATAHAHIHQLPTPPQMKKEVVRAIRKEIRKEERQVMAAYLGVKKVAPERLTEMVANLRRLKDLLASLLDATTEVIKGLYFKWIKKEG